MEEKNAVAKLAVLFVAFILMGIWAIAVVEVSWSRWEDKYYAKKVIKDPSRHSYCVKDDCRRPRPHKRMTFVKQDVCENKKMGWVCDGHLGLEE